jgi:hypothetical protein
MKNLSPKSHAPPATCNTELSQISHFLQTAEILASGRDTPTSSAIAHIDALFESILDDTIHLLRSYSEDELSTILDFLNRCNAKKVNPHET